MNFVDVVSQLQTDPTRFGLSRSYAAVSAFLLGLEIAGSGGDLVGFTEWLIPLVSGPDNYPWERLVVKRALGEERASGLSLAPLSPQEDEKTLAVLFALLLEFIEEKRGELFPLRRIYSRYHVWEQQQQKGSEGGHGLPTAGSTDR